MLAEVVAGNALGREEARSVMGAILAGEATQAQMAGLLCAMRTRGESPEEVAGMVTAMLDAAAPLDLPDADSTLDLVGTGGSGALAGGAFNVSTMASIVAAACGATVCKHGNRKASSSSGSTDLLEALDVEVELEGPGVVACVRDAGVGFAFARMFHPAMRHAAPVRAELGIPTVFNLLGPLSHPGRVGLQVLGVADPARIELVAASVAERGTVRTWVVHGEGGLDELTTTGASTVIEIRVTRRWSASRSSPRNWGSAAPSARSRWVTHARTPRRHGPCSTASPGRSRTWWCSTRRPGWSSPASHRECPGDRDGTGGPRERGRCLGARSTGCCQPCGRRGRRNRRGLIRRDRQRLGARIPRAGAAGAQWVDDDRGDLQRYRDGRSRCSAPLPLHRLWEPDPLRRRLDASEPSLPPLLGRGRARDRGHRGARGTHRGRDLPLVRNRLLGGGARTGRSDR
ncbi:MAG: anthranilate phosphoribosyltransferase [Microthrixaceae bacterium]